MRKLIAVLLLIFALTACGKADEIASTETTTTVETTTEYIIHEEVISPSYGYMTDWEVVKADAKYIMECEVVEKFPTILRGKHNLKMIDKHLENDPGRLGYLSLYINTPINVKVNRIFYAIDDEVKVGDIVPVDECCGNYKGLKRSMEGYKPLDVGSTYILMIDSADDGVTTFNFIGSHPQYYIKVDPTSDDYIVEHNEPNALVENVKSAEDLEKLLSST